MLLTATWLGRARPDFVAPAAGGAWDISSKTVALTQSLEAHPGLGYAGLIGANLVKLAPLLTGQLGVPLALLAAYGVVRHRGAWAWLLLPLASVPLVEDEGLDAAAFVLRLQRLTR